MAITFKDIADTLSEELHLSDDTAFRRHIIRALKFYRPIKFRFSEATYSLPLKLDQDEYTVADGIPVNIMSFDAITLVFGNGRHFIFDHEPTSIKDMRREQTHNRIRGYPRLWTWYAETFIVHPVPSITDPIKIDYTIDMTRDAATGAEITTAATSDNFTNPLLDQGEEFIMARAGYSYLLAKGGNAQKAQELKVLEAEALQALLAGRDQMKIKGRQITWNL